MPRKKKESKEEIIKDDDQDEDSGEWEYVDEDEEEDDDYEYEYEDDDEDDEDDEEDEDEDEEEDEDGDDDEDEEDSEDDEYDDEEDDEEDDDDDEDDDDEDDEDEDDEEDEDDDDEELDARPKKDLTKIFPRNRQDPRFHPQPKFLPGLKKARSPYDFGRGNAIKTDHEVDDNGMDWEDMEKAIRAGEYKPTRHDSWPAQMLYKLLKQRKEL